MKAKLTNDDVAVATFHNAKTDETLRVTAEAAYLFFTNHSSKEWERVS